MKSTPKNKKKVFLTGASGLLGSSLRDFSSQKYTFFGVARKKIPNYVDLELDITDYSSLNKLLNESKPDIIIHSAALASHRLCDENREFAKKINFESTQRLAEISTEINSKLIFISSDAVFSGKLGDYSELVTPDPFSYYGELKVLAENEIQKKAKDFLILRGSFYGTSIQKDRSIFEFFYHNLMQKNKVNGFSDVFSNSIDTHFFTQTIMSLVEKNLDGIFHYGVTNKYSKFDFGIRIAKLLNADEDLVRKVASAEINDPYFYPRDLSLNIGKLASSLDFPLPNIEESLTNFFNLTTGKS